MASRRNLKKNVISFDRLSDTTFVRFCLLQLCCNLFCTQPSKVESSVLQYGVCSYLPP